MQAAAEGVAAVDDDALEPRVGRRRRGRRPDDEAPGHDRRLEELDHPLLRVVRELPVGRADERAADRAEHRMPVDVAGHDELDERAEGAVVDAAGGHGQQPVERRLRVVRADAQDERLHVEATASPRRAGPARRRATVPRLRSAFNVAVSTCAG